MYKHILVPTDGTALSMDAVRKAVEFARAIGAKITFFHAKPDYPVASYDTGGFMESISPEQFAEMAEGQAQQFLGGAEEVARAAGVSCASKSETSDNPYQAIVDTATKSGCDLVFMASHGRRGIAAKLLGSETQKVLTHSKIPVLVCR